jgi:hypothetical protein
VADWEAAWEEEATDWEVEKVVDSVAEAEAKAAATGKGGVAMTEVEGSRLSCSTQQRPRASALKRTPNLHIRLSSTPPRRTIPNQRV